MIGNDEEARETLAFHQNLVDLAYSVRWNIRNPEYYVFQLADPTATVRAASESAMREAVANVTLDQAIGPGRTLVEAQVQHWRGRGGGHARPPWKESISTKSKPSATTVRSAQPTGSKPSATRGSRNTAPTTSRKPKGSRRM